MITRPRSLAAPLLLGALVACGCDNGGALPDAGPDLTLPGCGDNVLDDGEECDQGRANSDSAPDACRTSCRKPRCGDKVKDTGEACDDGNLVGGDGCTPLCTVEEPPLEKEPNDDPATANPWMGGVVHGAVAAMDRDCFSFDLPVCGAVSARLLGPCPQPATLSLFDPMGIGVATGGPAGDRCAVLDPAEASGARFVAGGRYALCVEGVLEEAVPFYALEIKPVPAAQVKFPLPANEDRDGDGVTNRCDPDRDGDGLDNDKDNCPDTPNGPNTPALHPTAPDGFIRQWLTVGAFVGKKSNKECRPTDDNLVGIDDARAAPALGDKAGSNTWITLLSASDRLEFLDDYGKAMAPREVYQAVYVRSETARNLTLGVGPDDGARVWWNGSMLLDIIACQGTNIDSSKVKVSVPAGTWNTLLIKVYDQGGGWGNYVRFLDQDKPVLDLDLSLSPKGPWMPDQSDLDGDGTGDVCDKTPRG